MINAHELQHTHGAACEAGYCTAQDTAESFEAHLRRLLGRDYPRIVLNALDAIAALQQLRELCEWVESANAQCDSNAYSLSTPEVRAIIDRALKEG